ncbi:hypothetical protein B0T19DRAFT_412008 [Cercophora scortea]|uniref:Uncharacterized protein n=1 Tax=Cercophora scortea TaxID=314031 RepID=A0AAE0J649_9PEZI|nr:hypothetical protein B0T19DRAFT_412008 [Cercophora scortea]
MCLLDILTTVKMHIYRGKMQFVGDDAGAYQEQLTLVILTSFHLGEPVYLCWQWTRVTDGDQVKNKVIAQEFGTISSVEPDGDDVRIGFYSNGDYLFAALVPSNTNTKPPFSSLRVWARRNDGSMAGTRSLHTAIKVYSCPTSTTSQIRWNFYVGKMTYNETDTENDSVDDEAIMVLFPNTCAVGDAVCTYFQWTAKADGGKKVNENLEGKIQSIDFDTGECKIKFSAGSTYRFEGTYSTVGDSLQLKMHESAGDKTSSSIHLDIAAPTKTRRTKRGLFYRTALVKNDTEETVVISLVDSSNSSTTKGRILTATGAALTFAGLMSGAAAPGTILAGLASGINIASAGFAVATEIDSWFPADRAVEDVVLFPGHSIHRVSTMIWGNSNAQILKFKIEGDKTLNLYSAVREDLGDAEWTLSQTLDGIKSKKLLSLGLDAAKEIVYRGFVNVEGFMPIATKSEAMSEGNLLELGAETIFTAKHDGTDSRKHGVWTDNKVSFEWDNTKELYYVQPTNPWGIGRSVSHHKNGRLSLRLRGYKVTTAEKYKALLSDNNFADEDDVLRFMGTVQVGHHLRVCSWVKGGELYKYGDYNNGELKLEKADSADCFVFLLIKDFLPYQRMV